LKGGWYKRYLRKKFLTAAQTITHTILKGIHSIFPPPGPNDNSMDKPISIKKQKYVMASRAPKKKSLFGGLMV